MTDIEKVKKLRGLTGAGFKDCNLAIKESKGDINKAVEILRVKGISKASKKMSRDAKEGVVAVSGNENKTSVIEVNCETDFVAKNEDFTNFVKELSELNNEKNSNVDELINSKMKNGETVKNNIVTLIAKIGEKITIGKTKTVENPLALESSLIEQSIIDKEQELVTEELKSSGKPEDIAKKISFGKMNKFKEENALLSQAWVMEPKKKVQDILKELSITDLKIKEFYRIKIGE